MDTVRTETITLSVGDGTSMKAFVAKPTNAGELPGLLVFQEAFGVNPHIRDVTQRYASEGYVAIAPDMFHRTAPGFEGSYDDFPACMPHLQALRPDTMGADIQAAFEWLQKDPAVSASAIGSVGFCVGGRISFLANTILPLKAAVSFYGGGIAPSLLSRASQANGPVLFFWGGLDAHIPPDQIRSITDAMKEAKKTYVNVEFSDADHAFFRDVGAHYNEAAAKQAWPMSLKFLSAYVRA